MRAIKRRILLIDADGVQTICMAKSLHRQGHHVIGFCSDRCSSGYATRWLDERYRTPASDSETFKETLWRFLEKGEIDLIVPMEDAGANFLSRNKELIEGRFNTICAVPAYPVFSIAEDKHSFMKLCKEYGFPHPATAILSYDGLVYAAQKAGFPSLIKPNISHGARGIVKVSSLNELEEKYPHIRDQFGECTLQKFIEQPGWYYNVLIYRDRQGNTAGCSIIKIRRYFPLEGGSSCYSETILHPHLQSICEAILKQLDWTGFADIDVIEDKHTGELNIIEINPRVPSSLQAGFAAGVDFGKILISDVFGEDFPEIAYKEGQQVRWLGLDVMWFLFSKDRFRFNPSWFRFIGKNVSYHDFSLNDPLPLFFGILSGIKKYLNPSFRKSKLGK